jgi:hypothetical protein
VAKFIIAKVLNKFLNRLKASDNILLKEMNKIGLMVVFVSIAVLMGTCFFAVNEGWTAAQAFYWTIITMTVRDKSSHFNKVITTYFDSLPAHVTLEVECFSQLIFPKWPFCSNFSWT